MVNSKMLILTKMFLGNPKKVDFSNWLNNERVKWYVDDSGVDTVEFRVARRKCETSLEMYNILSSCQFDNSSSFCLIMDDSSLCLGVNCAFGSESSCYNLGEVPREIVLLHGSNYMSDAELSVIDYSIGISQFIEDIDRNKLLGISDSDDLLNISDSDFDESLEKIGNLMCQEMVVAKVRLQILHVAKSLKGSN